MTLAQKVKQYFETSYKYYITYEETGISDMEYDYLCADLSKNFMSIPQELRQYLSQDSLKAGTGFDISMDTYKAMGVI